MTEHRCPATDAEAIRNLAAHYCLAVDDGRWDDFADLWAIDAVVEVMGDRHEGRDAIRAFLEAAQPPSRRGIHVVTNLAVEVDDDTARAHSDYVFVAKTGSGPQISSTGRYHDRFAYRDDRWWFAERIIEIRHLVT